MAHRCWRRDCVATIQRFARRDPFGGALMARTDELSAPSDKVIRFALKKPFCAAAECARAGLLRDHAGAAGEDRCDAAGGRGGRQRCRSSSSRRSVFPASVSSM